MLRFPFIEKYGVTAVMSDLADGDCCSRQSAQGFLEVRNIPNARSLALIRQVHGIDLIQADEISSDKQLEADGIISNTPGTTMAIRIADCVPIFLYAPNQNTGAIVHAGREGTHHMITKEAVSKLIESFQVRPDGLVAIIGPSAGPCCYEVSPEMASDFEKSGGVRAQNHLNLWETNHIHLQNCGLKQKNIEISKICTICSGQFHSYRRSGTKSRNIAVLHLPHIPI